MDFSVIPPHFKFVVPFVVVGFAIAFALFPSFIRQMKALQWGQQIREEGPQDHLSKKGTPTMGGFVVVLTLLLGSVALYFLLPAVTGGKFRLTSDYLVFLLVVLGNCALGFYDDYIKVKKSRSLGLRARDKLLVHILMGLALAWYMISFTAVKSAVFVPFLGNVELGWLLYPFCILVVSGCVNAFNLTDGLDGLAGGSGVISFMAFGLIMLYNGKFDLFLGVMLLIGALFAFMAFNCYPARIFMGDTGSLALGGALAALAVLTGTEIILFFVGGVYVMEALSVMVQVIYFKKTGGKRFFRMAPIHHHFALGGLHEVQVTTRFLLAGMGFALLGLYLYFAQM